MACRFALCALSVLALFACDSNEPSDVDTVVLVSPDPDTAPDGEPALIGKTLDFVTGERLVGAVVSTFPPTEVLRSNRDGEFVLRAGIVPGRTYEVRAEADGYAPRSIVVTAQAGKVSTVDLGLVLRDRAVPLRVEPPVVLFTPDRHRAAVLLTNEAPTELVLEAELPP